MFNFFLVFFFFLWVFDFLTWARESIVYEKPNTIDRTVQRDQLGSACTVNRQLVQISDDFSIGTIKKSSPLDSR